MNTRTRIDSKSAAYMADPNWVGEQAASILDAQHSSYTSNRNTARLCYRLFIDRDYIAFGQKLNELVQQRADDKAREDIDDEDSGIEGRKPGTSP